MTEPVGKAVGASIPVPVAPPHDTLAAATTDASRMSRRFVDTGPEVYLAPRGVAPGHRCVHPCGCYGWIVQRTTIALALLAAAALALAALVVGGKTFYDRRVGAELQARACRRS